MRTSLCVLSFGFSLPLCLTFVIRMCLKLMKCSHHEGFLKHPEHILSKPSERTLANGVCAFYCCCVRACMYVCACMRARARVCVWSACVRECVFETWRNFVLTWSMDFA